MPEGHVIHALARDLSAAFAGRTVAVSSPQGRFATEAALLDGTTLTHASAWGKHLFIEFDAPTDDNIVHIHLGLIGIMRLSEHADPVGQVRLRISDGHTDADLHGPQWCRLISPEAMGAVVGKQGADPLRPDSDPSGVFKKVARSRKTIGALLMDQKLFAGVGNIYRAETLFRLGISPFQLGHEIKDSELRDIWDDLVHLMAIGVERGRIDTVRDEHLPEAMGREPRKDDHGGEVYVYRREGQPCYQCGTPIRHQVMEGRNLFWCPTCQPKRRRKGRLG
ncbi:Fpg/Nei family DNA glycosylase [Corynebacterium renale]|uniref:DNA-(apurinic or apyrimidinic site) lyase n=1 Tax=Corynebacterium renale TaxID=1724 RepID=A0A2A9DM86_9CORY|nr:DNA-formamidopyrimidine glycosylase family protein [Corynebacterium renale]PFG27714.1 formamidopyrimidine-DNA glycosylase [Corynebacterium renale]SQI22220.1 DNA-formamidopyrimidine glycosylase [Corynebacterium renale]